MNLRLCIVLVFFTHTLGLFCQNKITEYTLVENPTTPQVQVYLDSSALQINRSFYAGNYAEAVEQANTVLHRTNDKGTFPRQFEIRSYLANTYLKLDELDKAQKIFEENLDKGKAFKEEEVIMAATIDLGNLSGLQGKREKAIAYLLEARAIAEKRKDARRIFITNYNIAELYILDEKKTDRAKLYLKLAENELDNLNNVVFNVSLDLLFGKYYLKMGEAQNSIMHFKSANKFAKSANLVDELSSSYEGLVQAQEYSGDYFTSLQTFKKWDSLKQKQFTLDKEKYKQSIENKLQNEEIKRQLLSKELENELIKERNFTNRLILYATLLTTLILIVFLFSLWRASNKRKKLILDLELKNKKYIEAKKQTEKLAKAKTKFFSTVTHDLRTPLYGIIGLTNTLADNPKLENHLHDIQALKFSADYLLALINDVLQINKLDTNKWAKLDSQQFSIHELMPNIVESLQYMKAQNNNSLEVIIEKDIPKYIIGDRLKLSQILMNLIANALKFTKNGNVLVTISKEEQSDDFVYLLFEIKDDGIGIVQEKQKLIFKEFGQIEKSGYFQGTGLGLSIVSKLLSQMKSKITLESDGVKGSKFYFKLKFEVSKDVKNLNPNTILSDKLDSLHNKKVLIVEDNLVNQLVTKRILSKHQMLFDVAQNGLEAVKMVEDSNYDLILMDINMPEMDGIVATKKIRTFNEQIPIILLTAVELVEIDERIQQLNYQDVIIKPYDLNSFLRVLIKHISS